MNMIFRAAAFAVVLFFGQAVAYVLMSQGGQHYTSEPSHADHTPTVPEPVCFRIGYGDGMEPCCLEIVACTPEFLREGAGKIPGGARGVSAIRPADAQQAARLIDQEIHPHVDTPRLPPSEPSCCFRIGYGVLMEPTNLVIEPRCTAQFLIEAPKTFPGGAMGVAPICPLDAEEAAKFIDQEIHPHVDTLPPSEHVLMSQGGHYTSEPSHADQTRFHPFSPIIPTHLEQMCCFRIGYGALMEPSLKIEDHCTEKFLDEAPRKFAGGAMGFSISATCPVDAETGASWIDEEIAYVDSICCFRIGYGVLMKPTNLVIEPRCTAKFLIEAPRKTKILLGGAMGVAPICPLDAEEAAKFIDQEIHPHVDTPRLPPSEHLLMSQGGHDTSEPSHADHTRFHPFSPIIPTHLEKMCCFRIGYGALMEPSLKIEDHCTEKFLDEAPRKFVGGAMGVSTTCPVDAEMGARWIAQEIAHVDEICCFRIGYGDEMKPTSLVIEPRCTAKFLIEAPKKILFGGAMGVAPIAKCPKDAEEAARLIELQPILPPGVTVPPLGM